MTLAACGPGHNNTASGTVVGAVAGGLLANAVSDGSGGQAAATALGAVVGGILGHEIGRSLDERDRRRAQEAEYRALEYGQSGRVTPWRNPDSGRHGTVIPGRPYRAEGRQCRSYTHTISHIWCASSGSKCCEGCDI